MAILLFIYSINACLFSTVRDIAHPVFHIPLRLVLHIKHDYTRFFLMLSKLHQSNGKKKNLKICKELPKYILKVSIL